MTETSDPDRVAPDVMGALEAVLMVIDRPASCVDLAAAVEAPVERVRHALEALAAEYAGAFGARRRGFELREVGGGWRIYSRGEHAPAVERFVRDGAATRLSPAALETLAIVAYKGPITRGRIAQVRGVGVDSVTRTLLGRGLIEEVGVEEGSGAILYATTDVFLEQMGISSLRELEPLEPRLPRGDALDEIKQQVE
ncbi:MAG: SMC-Scp complex subunit ScpB [Bifidobacteriaceae bacterium]|nr:SMC-Scp complex subunit ScpB [Bifidobacteriaceae bacterium]